MTVPLKKIALLHPIETPETQRAVARFQQAAKRIGIQSRGFNKSDPLVEYAPDCILAFSCQDAKLTPIPTYGLMMDPVAHYLQTGRFVRTHLTYDAYLTLSPSVETWIKDITFGVRKFSRPIAAFACTVPATEFVSPPAASARLIYGESTPECSRWITLLPLFQELDRDGCIELYAPPGTWSMLPPNARKGPAPLDDQSLLNLYRQAGAGLILHSADSPDDTIPGPGILEVVAASAVAITSRHPFLERVFGDSLLYVEAQLSPEETARQVRAHLSWIRHNPKEAIERARAAHGTFLASFALERLFPALLELHTRVLVEKGYQPDPNPEAEAALPSVTYIMRTGGGRPLPLLRRALNSLVAQQYPRLSALFVLFQAMPEVTLLQQEYPGLNIQVVEDLGGLRSTAICAGMRAVQSDLFGLLDDDDYLHPNHIRMLVKALQYHNGRNWRGSVGMAYSGSVEVSDSEPRPEQGEYEDAYALNRRELRALEHYRIYNSAAMSEHRWYLINTWLVRRSLVDNELLDDPCIHTCEDLYIALQFAQKSFLAFSGEVTTVHFFGRHGNSTLQDCERHLPDTLRIATRTWSRTFPTECVPYARLMPLGRDLKKAPDAYSQKDFNILGRLMISQAARRQGGLILWSGAADLPEQVSTVPIKIEPGFYSLSVQFEADEMVRDDRSQLWLEVLDDTPASGPLATAIYRGNDFARYGDSYHADIVFRVEAGAVESAIQIRIQRAVGLEMLLRRVMLLRRKGL